MLKTLKKPFEIAAAVCEVGVRKTHLSTGRMLSLAILAGAYIGFGAQLATTVTMDTISLLGVGLSNLLAGAVFSVGLMLVVLGGAELFTGNSLILLSLWSKRAELSGVIRN